MFAPSAGPDAKLAQLLSRVIEAGDSLLDALPENAEYRRTALGPFSSAVDQFSEALPQAYVKASAADLAYLQAAAQIEAGALLVAGGHAAQTGDRTELRNALDRLQVEQDEWNQGKVSALFFDEELFKLPPRSPSAEDALKVFKNRASRTLDDMVAEARDVILSGIEKIGKTFHSFSEELAQLAESFISAEVMPVIKMGVQRVIAGLKMLADFLKSHNVKKALDLVNDVIDADKKFSLEEVLPTILSVAFGCGGTKQTIQNLVPVGALYQQQVETAEAQMVELSVQYVHLLKAAVWVLRGLSIAGAFLVLTGVGAHYSALGIPVAYAIVTVATLVIGTEFAEVKMRSLLEPLKASGVHAS